MKYDIIIIGGGTAGLAAYRKAISMGKKALIIEANDFVTTCADTGCMPSKLLIAASENMHMINQASKFGINVNNVEIDEQMLWNRIRTERDRFVGFVKEGANNIPSENKIIGYAKIINEHAVEVNNTIIKTEAIVIATGSKPFIPELFTEIKEEILTNENVFELNHIPESIAVFGAGVIGLELGFAFKNLGSKITLFNRGNKLLQLGENVNDYLVKHIEDSFDFIYQDTVTKVEKKDNGYLIYYGNKNKWVEKIIIATGRTPNLNNIGLNNIGLSSADVLNKYNTQTTQVGTLPLFLAGDVNNEVTLLHEAAKEGNIAGYNGSMYPIIKEHKRNVFMAIVFSHPQIMQVGQINNFTNEVIKGEVSFEDQGRSRVMLKNKGVLNIYFDKSNGLLLGAEMIGPDAEHVAHMLAWLIEKKTTIHEILELPFYHPVIEEGIRTAVRNAYSKK